MCHSTSRGEDAGVINPSVHQVACMQFINIVVHSVENMNFRVFLQYQFTSQGLDDYLEASLAFEMW